MKPKLPAAFLVAALALLVLVARPVSAHDNGRNHWDGRVYHDYRYGGHVTRYFTPYGTEIDRVHRDPRPYAYRYHRYNDHHCDDRRFGRGSGGYFGNPRSGYYYNGYRRSYGYPSYNRGWWGW